MPAAFHPDPEAACDACGRFGAFRFETETLCGDCYAGRGSCCSAEFSGRPECKQSPASPAVQPNANTAPPQTSPDKS